ncbi:hypothetical protein [Amycolatopsis sp. NPDC059021]|uniref:hypothetical protein n=1 Tax=Amycolatopsis sp. NPDC059021 TaxID=3346704 RepID=UPI00366F3A05
MTRPAPGPFPAAVHALLSAGFLEIPILTQPPRTPHSPQQVSDVDARMFLRHWRAVRDVVFVFDPDDAWGYRVALEPAPPHRRGRIVRMWARVGPAVEVITDLLGLPAPAPDFSRPHRPTTTAARPCRRTAPRPRGGSTTSSRSRRRIRVADTPAAAPLCL